MGKICCFSVEDDVLLLVCWSALGYQLALGNVFDLAHIMLTSIQSFDCWN